MKLGICTSSLRIHFIKGSYLPYVGVGEKKVHHHWEHYLRMYFAMHTFGRHFPFHQMAYFPFDSGLQIVYFPNWTCTLFLRLKVHMNAHIFSHPHKIKIWHVTVLKLKALVIYTTAFLFLT